MKKAAATANPKDRFVIIMAGGRGERFWPVSREKTPKQLITVVVLSFVIPIALIVLLVSFVTGGKKVDGQGLALKPEAIAEIG